MSDIRTNTPSDNPADRLKVGYLVAGLVCLGIAGAWALRAAGAIGPWDVGVVVPVVLVAAGAIGLVAMLVGGLRRRRPAPTTDELSSTTTDAADADADADAFRDDPETTTDTKEIER